MSYGPHERLLAATRIEKAQRDLEEVRASLANLRGDLNTGDDTAADVREKVRRASVLVVQASAQLDQARGLLP